MNVNRMKKNVLLALLGAAAMQAQCADNFYRYGSRKQYPIPDSGNGAYKAPVQAVDSRQLQEFSIKGYKVMAYSKKDAITRLKHQKKI